MPQINSSFNPLLIKKVDKIAKKNKKSRSETIERLTELGIIYSEMLDKQAKGEKYLPSTSDVLDILQNPLTH